jgi:site-specific recombinase XerD
VTSEIPVPASAESDESASEITKRPPGARPTGLPGDLTALLAGYAAELADTTLSAETCRTYISRVRQYLAWLAATHRRRRPGDQDPLTSPKARDFAVRDYRRWLLHEGPIKRSVVYANSALTAIDDFCLRRGLGASKIDRDDLPRQAPRALEEKARIRWLRAVEQVTSPRDRCIALIPYYAGARISEVVRLDTGDVRRSARKGVLRIYGKGDKVREVPIHAKLRPGLEQWLTERAAWPGAGTSPALFLNTKGGRLSARAAGGIIAAIAEQAALDDDPTAHVLRHTFATSLVRGKTDLVVVAELMGHSRLDTTRQHSCPPNGTRPTRLTTSPPTTEVTNRRSGPVGRIDINP